VDVAALERWRLWVPVGDDLELDAVRCENSADARISKNRRVDAFEEACGLGNLGPICRPNDTQARMTRTRAGKGRMPVEIARRVGSVSSRHDWECATHTWSLGDRQFAFWPVALDFKPSGFSAGLAPHLWSCLPTLRAR
jgi:hypothetical protein